MRCSGWCPTPRPRWSEVLANFFELTRDRIKGKAPDQVARWEDPRKLTVDNMIAVWGDDRPIDRLDRADALAFRKWWADRVEAGHSANTANKQFGFASDIFQHRQRSAALRPEKPLQRPAAERGQGREGKARADPGRVHSQRDPRASALDALNREARDILLAMVKTGAGPAEIIGLEAEIFSLDHEFPHIKIRPNDTRTLKTAHGLRARDVAAVGGLARRPTPLAGRRRMLTLPREILRLVGDGGQIHARQRPVSKRAAGPLLASAQLSRTDSWTWNATSAFAPI